LYEYTNITIIITVILGYQVFCCCSLYSFDH